MAKKKRKYITKTYYQIRQGQSLSRKRYSTLAAADKAALRYARQNKGLKFSVERTIESYSSSKDKRPFAYRQTPMSEYKITNWRKKK